jgi:2-polyprenyl-3-methyl-5-hydroxy-6-metoxy-1,4-benzoquinol methylase
MHILTGGRDAVVRTTVLRRIQPNERLLDVGCGSGTLAVAAARRGIRVVGIDGSRAMLRLAREKVARANVSIELREGRVPVLPALGAAFDVATATFVLSELSREEAALAIRAMAQAVRPGGQIIIADEAPPYSPGVRFIATLQHALVGLLAFAFLQKLAPTRRHPLRTLIAEAGLSVREEISYQHGALRLLVAERPAILSTVQRATKPLVEALPCGLARAGLRIAAWFALPVPVASGVYRIGSPGPNDPVLLTGNFLASVEAVRHALADRAGYLLVADTSGWNVWCASDAGLFTAEKAAALIGPYDVERLVAHRRIVIPRLAGRIRTPLAALTHWDVVTGPIEARDLPDFLQGGVITPAMRSLDRMYQLRERLRVGALTMMQMPLWLLPLRVLPKPLRRAVQYYAIIASWVLPVFHYQLPGRTGVVKSCLFGSVLSLVLLTRKRRLWGHAIAIVLSAPLIGWIYQSSCPVIYWKRLWK